ncbi:TPA: fimbria/pilus periplasmic chaperone [Klebsiella aerogenes]|nr:fimbria/pilus periplasmic chaperone [Klebsiella aerogenes]
MFKNFVISVGLCLVGIQSVHAGNDKPEQHVNTFTLKLSASRLIYGAESAGATLTVENKQSYPVLVRSRVLKEDKRAIAPFLVTPPLFRLDAGQQASLGIVSADGVFASDREELFWLCVAGVPPEMKSSAATGGSVSHTGVNINISMNNCIKLIVRPQTLSGTPLQHITDVTWSQHGKHIIAKNNSPYFINLMNVSVEGRAVTGVSYLPPFSSTEFSAPGNRGNSVDWNMINDLGGISQMVHTSLAK